MPVIVNNQRILPAPLVSFSKEMARSEDGTPLGSNYKISLQGKILQNKGNPVASTGVSFASSFSAAGWTSTISSDDDPLHNVGNSDLLISTITKQEQIRDLFTPATGIKVEIVGFDHNKGLRFYGNLASLNFAAEGNWAMPCDYTVELECSTFIDSANSGVFPSGTNEDGFTYYIDSASEDWSIQEADQVIVSTGNFNTAFKVYNLTHSLNAKGKLAYDAVGVAIEPWKQASGYVRSLSGPGNLPAGIIATIGSGYTATNKKVVENINKLGGTYGLEETYTYLSSGLLPQGKMALEECNINIDRQDGSLTTVSIQGTIAGLETNDPVSSTGVSKYVNASGYFSVIEPTLYSRVQQNSGLSWVHPRPLNTSVSRLPNAGQITYSYNYDTRPPNFVSGSISEDISVNDTYPGQIISITPVIGRNQPVLGYLGSRSEYKRTLNINVNMDTITRYWSSSDVNSAGYWTNVTATGIRNMFITQKPSVTQTAAFQLIYDAINPANEANVVVNKVFHSAPQESWSPRTGAYSYSIEWTYEKA